MTRYATHMCESLTDSSRATTVHRHSYLICGEHNYWPALSPLGLYTAWTCPQTCTGHQRFASVTESAAVYPPTLEPVRTLTKVGFHLTTFSGSPEPRPSPVGDWTGMLGTSHPLEAAHKALTGRGVGGTDVAPNAFLLDAGWVCIGYLGFQSLRSRDDAVC